MQDDLAIAVENLLIKSQVFFVHRRA
ncbi:uncharacterized protein METZ01_LOCUS7657 [marine metagenome]|uniref:Uncharacterized protein n=1 Tax=marine metagenome TaxID=408172 RepID=A0A381NMP2_9ZZZZ